ncbi:MAG: hypothetical protein LBK63_05900 [Treponema sp.]|jgi:hypothetical protein|nr:hypothetical protein [Treponema sp.]
MAFCIILVAASAKALDFGMVLTQGTLASNEAAGAGVVFSYLPVASPWVAGPLGGSFSLYLSGSLGFDLAADLDGAAAWRDPPALPELGRAELTWTASPSLYVSLGRQSFQDPAGLVAAGLFDGLSAGFSAAGSRFTAGVWYTGLLYKERADIMMTLRDRAAYQTPFALDGDGGYFASRRAMVSLDWEKPDLGPRSSLALGVLAQLDVNGDEDRLHTQYLSVRLGSRLAPGLELRADGIFGAGEDPAWAVFFAGGLGLAWTPAGALDQRLSFRGLYSSPSLGDRLRPFTPVSSVSQGQVFSPALGGLSTFRGVYSLRPLASLSLTGEFSYFIRVDTATFQDSREPDKQKDAGYFLGGEGYAALAWTPLPDLALTLGGGAFFPRLGNVFTEAAGIRWKAALTLMLSF